MIDPEAWPLWLQFLLFSPMIVGIVSLWLSSAKEPEWRAVQIGCIIYALRIRYLRRLEISYRIRGCSTISLGVCDISLPEKAEIKLKHYPDSLFDGVSS